MQNKISSWLKKTVRRVFVAGGIFLTGYSAIRYQAMENKFNQENQKIISQSTESITITDTQGNNEEINYNEFGSGDLIFMKHDCARGFTVGSIRKCYTHKAFK